MTAVAAAPFTRLTRRLVESARVAGDVEQLARYALESLDAYDEVYREWDGLVRDRAARRLAPSTLVRVPSEFFDDVDARLLAAVRTPNPDHEDMDEAL